MVKFLGFVIVMNSLKKFYCDKNITLNQPELIPDLDRSAEKFKNINLKENKEIIADLKRIYRS